MKIQSMSTKELATVYNVGEYTFKNWIKPHLEKIGKKVGWYYTPAQVRIIKQLLGEPE
jgi:transposase